MAPAVEETLAAEAEHRPRAGIGALVAAALTLLGGILLQVVSANVPSDEADSVHLPEALRGRIENDAQGPGLGALSADYIGEHVLPYAAAGAVNGLGYLVAFIPLAYLWSAVKARNDAFTRAPLVLSAIGAVAAGLGLVVYFISSGVEFAGFSDLPGAEQTSGAAREALNAGAPLASGAIAQLGRLVLAGGVILISLNAMRVGLLGRFLGILGILVGVTLVLPLDQIGFIRSIWLLGVGATILLRLPGGTPPAWLSGRAEPWPTQQQLRERREAERRGEEPPAPVVLEKDEPAESAGIAHPASKKKKRKRRE